VKRLAARFTAAEDALAVALLTAMSVLPVLELIARQFGLPAIPGSTVFVQHLTLWVAAAQASRASRLRRSLPNC